MQICKSIGCKQLIADFGDDYCPKCLAFEPIQPTQPKPPNNNQAVQDISSGGDNDYWIANITDPKRLPPCQVECEDIIELFQMTFQEGEAFKALWRKGQMRIGNGKPGDTLIRNSEKVQHFGARMVAIENREQ